MRRFITTTAIVAVLAGCAAPKELADARFKPGTLCCRSFSELPYQPLLLGGTVRVEVDNRAPAFEFPEGTSRFVAFRLPDAPGTLHLRLKSTIVGTQMREAFVFFPGITFLDAHHQQLQYFDPKMKFESGFMASTETMGWVTEIAVPSAARYVALHKGSSSPSRLYYKEGVDSAPGTVVPIGKSAMYLSSNWWDVYLPTAPAGRLQVSLPSIGK